MKVILILGALVALCTGLTLKDITSEWNNFKVELGKSYKSTYEERFRKNVFLENKNMIDEHNLKYEAGEVTYTMKMNRFGDMMTHEIKSTMNGFKKSSAQNGRNLNSTFIKPANVELPGVVDWRDNGAVTPVKDQAKCGSCWAFSTTGTLEGQHYRKTGNLISLSEQNLVDCSGDYGNMGCSGGNVENALQFIKDNRGIDTEETYPYEAIDRQCRFKPNSIGAKDKGFVVIEEGNEDDLKSAVATIGPISVSIDASQKSFHFYEKGIYFESACDSQNLDHSVLAVGYGTDNKQDYWLVKNSWNTNWGIKGYIKMARNRNNNCGIASDAVYPLV